MAGVKNVALLYHNSTRYTYQNKRPLPLFLSSSSRGGKNWSHSLIVRREPPARGVEEKEERRGIQQQGGILYVSLQELPQFPGDIALTYNSSKGLATK